jgi:Transglycosylase SLT domain
VAGVDRLLTRGHGLFPAGGGDGGAVFAAGGGEGGVSVPAPPAGGGGLTGGAGVAGGVYQQTRSGVAGLAGDCGQSATDAGGVGVQGRAGSGAVVDSARGQAAAIAPMSGSAAGMRLMVSTMDERLAAMQRQIDTTTAQNQVLAIRLRQVAEAYRGVGSSGMTAGMPLGGLGGLPTLGGGGGGGSGGLSGLSSLAALPGSLMGRGVGGHSTAWGAAEPGGGPAGAAGVAAGAIALSEVSFEGKGVWPGGRGAVRRYVEEALDRMGISEPGARQNWISGMTTIADHESGFRADAINLSDSNAHGPRQADGGPLNSSRGPWQVVPATFAKYHQPGTSNHIWDPVANACASMNYQMSRYGVAHDAHNQRLMVAQANVGVHHGY